MSRREGAGAGGPAPVLFVHYGSAAIRGSERVLLDLLAHLDRERFAPTVWCNAEVFASAVRGLGLPAHVSPMPVLLGWDAPRFDVAGYRRLVAEGVRLADATGARLIHANSGAPNQWMVPVARRRDLPLVAHLHAHYQTRDRCTLRLYEAPVLVGCSAWVTEAFAADGVSPLRLRTIPNGVDVARIGSGDATRLRAALGIAPDDFVVVGVGSLLMGKGWDILFRAVRVLANRGRSPVVVLAGEGADGEVLRRMPADLGIARHVHFLGERADAGAILRDVADVSVLPSRFESFGLAAAEAGAQGVPCIVSDIPGLREVVVEGETGLRVPPGDEDALADAIARLADDAALRRELGEGARRHVRTHFTTERMAGRFEELYAGLIARGGHGGPSAVARLQPCLRYARSLVARRLGISGKA